MSLSSHFFLGAFGEQIVASYLLSQKFEVFVPLLGASRCDLIYTKDGKTFIKAQIKTINPIKRFDYLIERVLVCNHHTRKGATPLSVYTDDEVDEIWIVGTSLWRMPIEFCKDRTALTLSSNLPIERLKTRTKGRIRNYNPDDFIVVKGTYEKPFKDCFSG